MSSDYEYSDGDVDYDDDEEMIDATQDDRELLLTLVCVLLYDQQLETLTIWWSMAATTNSRLRNKESASSMRLIMSLSVKVLSRSSWQMM